ncbi:MAG: hypothetical protein HN403_13430 [Rhodospirillales bacterium]|nr:hypothetical protein [Rhodospirillales bacterium]
MAILIRLVALGVLAISLASCSGPHDHAKLDSIMHLTECGKFDEYRDHVGSPDVDTPGECVRVLLSEKPLPQRCTSVGSLGECATTLFIEKLLPQIGGKDISYVSSQLEKEGFSCGQIVFVEPDTKTETCRILHRWLSPHLVFGYNDVGYRDWTVVATKQASNPIKIVVTRKFLGDKLPDTENRK